MLPLLVSHRGGSLLWPENSLLAFHRSLALGGDPPLDFVECDVHLSADGVPVVIHDDTLDRTTEGSGPVSALDAEALSRVRLRGAGGEGVPTLAVLAALVAAFPVGLQVEIKAGPGGGAPPAGLLERSLAVLDAAGLRARSGIIAFHRPTAAAAREAGGLDHVAWLLGAAALRDGGHDGAAARARAEGFGMIEARLDAFDAPAVATWRRAGIRAGCWGANDAGGLARALSLGLDAVATDDPVLALRLRRAARDGAGKRPEKD